MGIFMYFRQPYDFQFITSGMICLLAMRILGMENITDIPGDSPYTRSEKDKDEYFRTLVQAIINETAPSLPTANSIIDAADFEDNYPFCCCKTGT